MSEAIDRKSRELASLLPNDPKVSKFGPLVLIALAGLIVQVVGQIIACRQRRRVAASPTLLERWRLWRVCRSYLAYHPDLYHHSTSVYYGLLSMGKEASEEELDALCREVRGDR